MTRVAVATAGESLLVECQVGWVSQALARGVLGETEPAEPAGREPTVHLVVEARRRPFLLPGADRVTRGAWSDGTSVLLEDACGSGFDLLVQPQGGLLVVRARWSPPARTRALAVLAHGRAELLLRAALEQYPVLWWSGVRGRAPLHVSAVQLEHSFPVLAGPSGVGKSTLVDAELRAGNRAACDNLATSDGRTLWGVVEPRRVSGGPGRRTSHGRRESAFPQRLACARPDRVVVVALSESAERAHLLPLDPLEACRRLVAGTYMAGELRRYWPFAATLAAGTGLGPASPPVEAVAGRLTGAAPCQLLTLSRRTSTRLSDAAAATG